MYSQVQTAFLSVVMLTSLGPEKPGEALGQQAEQA